MEPRCVHYRWFRGTTKRPVEPLIDEPVESVEKPVEVERIGVRIDDEVERDYPLHGIASLPPPWSFARSSRRANSRRSAARTVSSGSELRSEIWRSRSKSAVGSSLIFIRAKIDPQ
jgi:hypothetical protein